jgi:hypothetical protein
MAKAFELASGADLVVYIGKIGRAGAKLDKMIQHAAVHAIGHAIAHGDIKYANELLEALPKGGRKQAFVKFMETYGPFAFSTQGKKFAFFKRDGLAFDGSALIEGKQWHETIKEEVVSTLDVEDMVAKMLKRIESAVAKDSKSVKGMDLYSAVAAAVADYHSTKAVEEEEVELPNLKAA